MAKRLMWTAHAKHLKSPASLAIVKELTTQVNTVQKNMSSKECSDSDEVGELKDLHLGDADSCEVLASFIEED